jgi:hypothetical protein
MVNAMPAVVTPKLNHEKLDLYRVHAADYAARRDPAIANIARCQYLAIDGSGTPGGPEFQACIGALYKAAFTIKMARKFAGQDYSVCKMEGLWPDPRTWSLLIRTPDFITREHLHAAVAQLIHKGNADGVEAVRLLPLHEGWCVQALHVGPYSEEPVTMAELSECAAQAGMEFYGTLHEIYLADPRRVPPEKLKTILRQPVRDR